MIVVAAIAIPLGWKMNRLRYQRAVVAEIETIGGSTEYRFPTYAGFEDDVNTLAVPLTEPPQPPGPKWLRRIVGDDIFNPIARVRINDSRLTDELVTRIAGGLQSQSQPAGGCFSKKTLWES
jgi:hypothetical protein